MKKAIIGLVLILGIGLFSCNKSNDPTPSTSQKSASTSIVGTFDALFTSDYNEDIPVTLTVTQGTGDTLDLNVVERDNSDVSEFTLQAVGSNTTADVVRCDNKCYQGDMNVTDGGTIGIVNGKVQLDFEAWDPYVGEYSTFPISIVEE